MTERHLFPAYEGKQYAILNPEKKPAGVVILTFDKIEYREGNNFRAPPHMNLDECLKHGFVEEVRS
jgi:hypothetical protein